MTSIATTSVALVADAIPGSEPIATPAIEKTVETLPQMIERIAISVGVPNEIDNITKVVWDESRNNPDAKNPRSSSSGLAGFTDPTWVDCQKRFGVTGEKNDPENQITCTAEFFKAGEHWRWVIFNCWMYAKNQIPHLPNTIDLKPNVIFPHVGGIIIMDYDGIPHYPVVQSVTKECIQICESNLTPGEVTCRCLSWDDTNIEGYWYKEYAQ